MANSKYISNLVDRVSCLDRVWDILVESYRDVLGGMLFDDKFELLKTTHAWRVIYVQGKIVAVAVYKAKHGLKMVAMGADKKRFGKKATVALGKAIRDDLYRVWMEVSEGAEVFVMKYCDGYQHAVSNDYAELLLQKKVTLSSDGYHYSRKILGIEKQKIIIGTIHSFDDSSL